MAEPARHSLRSYLLGNSSDASAAPSRRRIWRSASGVLIASAVILFVIVCSTGGGRRAEEGKKGIGMTRWGRAGGPDAVESEVGVVAADDWRCSEVGAAALRAGGHAVDSAVAATLCLGVVHSMSSGIGGGAFIVVRSAASGEAEAIDSRETAPSSASTNMYEANPSSKSKGALSMGIPGELAGLHTAWLKYGRLPWRSLFQPAISLARDGFVVVPFLAEAIKKSGDAILADPGLREVLAPNGKLLQTNDICYNPALAHTLEVIATEGVHAFYNGSIGEKFIKDVRSAGGIATMDDLEKYEVKVTKAMAVEAMGYTILGMPPPSSGTVGMSLVLNILGSYKSLEAVKELLGLHRFIEALKHMFAARMNLADPAFVNVDEYVSEMLSPSFAQKLQQKIVDNTTFEPSYYLARWSQLRDHGTSHLCVVDADRNAVSLTSTVNWYFGAKVLSPSTGIVLNNEMDDFCTPTEVTPDHLPPAPANFIEPGKRPLSSMTPIIVLKDNQLAGVVGGSGGVNIIPAVLQVFLNHFILEMDPLKAVQHPRLFHKMEYLGSKPLKGSLVHEAPAMRGPKKGSIVRNLTLPLARGCFQLIPNEVLYENFTAIDGERFELAEDAKLFLERRGHVMRGYGVGAVSQLVVHNIQEPFMSLHRRTKNNIVHGMLTAVSDPRKDGSPAGV